LKRKKRTTLRKIIVRTNPLATVARKIAHQSYGNLLLAMLAAFLIVEAALTG